MRSKIKSTVSAFCRDTSGAATLEFVVLVPFLMIVIFMFAEIGILTGRKVLLKRGVSIAARDIRLGNTVDEEAFRRTACRNAFLISSCFNELRVEMVPHDVASGQNPNSNVYCPNRFPDPNDAAPNNNYTNGVDGDIMIIKACLIVNPVFPGAAFAAGLPWAWLEPGLTSADGAGYAIIARSAVMIECEDQDQCT